MKLNHTMFKSLLLNVHEIQKIPKTVHSKNVELFYFKILKVVTKQRISFQRAEGF